MFLEIWKFANEQAAKDFDKEQAQIQILSICFRENPKLARRLMSEHPKQDSSTLSSRGPAGDDNVNGPVNLPPNYWTLIRPRLQECSNSPCQWL